MSWLSVLALTGALCGPPQEVTLEEVNILGREISARVREAKTTGNVLTVTQALRTLEAEYARKGPVAQEVLSLYLMQCAAELGDYAEAHRYADLGTRVRPAGGTLPSRSLEEYEAVEALEALADLAAEELVVLINEAHHVPQHRAFTLELLYVLRELGFTHFAAETLNETDVQLTERGYPTKATGAYIDEPLYGDLVRTALALGYVVVPYEAMGGDRELGQATNLIERVLEVDPDARLVVHAGYAHINERGAIAGSRAMAGQLKEITGIDPLTIDQTVMTEHSTTALEHSLYGQIVDERTLTAASILVDETDAPWSLEPGTRDVTLFHPRSVLAGGRPTWLRLGGRRLPYALPADACGDEPRCLVQARAANEGADAIPLDRVEVVAGKPVPALLLPPGEYVLEVQDVAGGTLSTRSIEVP